MGAFVISMTPFDREGHLDENGLREHLRRLAAAGVGVYVGGGASGEGFTLSDDEATRASPSCRYPPGRFASEGGGEQSWHCCDRGMDDR